MCLFSKKSSKKLASTIRSIENYTEKDFGDLSDAEVKQAMLDIVDEFGVDDWYQDYQQSLEMEA